MPEQAIWYIHMVAPARVSNTAPVFVLWVGLSRLATTCFTVWETAGVSVFDPCNYGMATADCLMGFIAKTCKAIMVWVPYTKTNGQWIASKILQGFFGAPIESLCEISVTDIVSFVIPVP